MASKTRAEIDAEFDLLHWQYREDPVAPLYVVCTGTQFVFAEGSGESWFSVENPAYFFSGAMALNPPKVGLAYVIEGKPYSHHVDARLFNPGARGARERERVFDVLFEGYATRLGLRRSSSAQYGWLPPDVPY